MHQQQPTNPPCVYDDSTTNCSSGVQQKKKGKKRDGDLNSRSAWQESTALPLSQKEIKLFHFFCFVVFFRNVLSWIPCRSGYLAKFRLFFDYDWNYGNSFFFKTFFDFLKKNVDFNMEKIIFKLVKGIFHLEFSSEAAISLSFDYFFILKFWKFISWFFSTFENNLIFSSWN